MCPVPRSPFDVPTAGRRRQRSGAPNSENNHREKLVPGSSERCVESMEKNQQPADNAEANPRQRIVTLGLYCFKEVLTESIFI